MISTSSSANWESGDEIECAKSRHFRPILAFFGSLAQMPEWLAGAGGIEPPNGGIKTRLIMQRFQGAFGKNGQKLSSNINSLPVVSK